MKGKSSLWLPVFLAILAFRAPARAANEPVAEISPALAGRLAEVGPAGEVKVWAFFRDGCGPLYDPADLDRLLAGGGRLRCLSRWLNAVSIETNGADIARLAALDFIRKLQPVRVFRRPTLPPLPAARPADTPPDTGELFIRYGRSASQLAQIGVPALHDRDLTGSEIRIAIFDTGFYKGHEALSSLTVLAERDFVDGDDNTQDDTKYTSEETPYDDHGTAVWSILGGNVPGTMVGPAYGAEFILARTENNDYERRSEEDWYVAALEWADSLGADIVSSSLGYTDFDDGFAYSYADLNGDVAVTTVAADIAASKGILVVTAMGNYPQANFINSPADGDSVIAVGAVKYDSSRADFSIIGPSGDGRIKPELATLGSNTYAARAGNPAAYGRVSGTSAATPLAAGLAALVWQAKPDWGPMQVREALIATASQRDHPDNLIGWGIPNGPAAVEYVPGGIQLTWFTAENLGDRIRVEWGLLDWSRVGSLRLLRREGSDGPYLGIGPEDFAPDEGTSFVDSLVQRNKLYSYKLAVEDKYQIEDVEEFGPIAATVLPLEFSLTQNYPNPFNLTTTIEFRLPEQSAGPVRLLVYNILGRQVRTLVDEDLEPGFQRAEFDGRGDRGESLPSGVYFYRLQVAGWPAVVRKMMLVR